MLWQNIYRGNSWCLSCYLYRSISIFLACKEKLKLFTIISKLCFQQMLIFCLPVLKIVLCVSVCVSVCLCVSHLYVLDLKKECKCKLQILCIICLLGNDPLTDEENNHDINSVAGVLKLYFRGLENPLFPKERFNDLISCVSKCLFFFFFAFY